MLFVKKYTFDSFEVTDNQTLRNIKLDKIRKNDNNQNWRQGYN